MVDILEESRNPAIEAYRAAYIANSSNSTPNSNSNPSKKGKNRKRASFMLGSYNLAIEEEEEESDSSSNSRYKKRKDFKGKGLKTSSNKAKYKDNKPRRRPRDPALYNSWLYDTGSTDYISNSKERFTTFTPNTGQLRPINTGNSPVSPAGIGSITLEVLSRKAPPTYTKLVLDNVLYLPNININIVSRVRHYDSGGYLIKETLYGGDRRYIAVLDFKKSGFFLDVKGSSKPILHANFAFPLGLSSYTTKSIEPPIIEDAIVSEAIEPNKRYKLRNSPAKGTTLEVIEGNKVEKAISSPTLKEPNIGHIGLRLLKKTSSITKGLPNFDKIKEADFHYSSCNRGPIVANAIKGFFRGIRNGFGRYPTKFHFGRGTEITDLLTTWLAKRGIKFSTSVPYIHKQNGLVERSVRVILDPLSAVQQRYATAIATTTAATTATTTTSATDSTTAIAATRPSDISFDSPFKGLSSNFKKSGFFLDVKGSSKPILHANLAFSLGLSSHTTKNIELQRNKIVVEIPSNSIRKEDYRPFIEDAIVSEAIEPNKRYKLRNSPAKGTTLEGVGPSLRGKRPRRPTREPEPLTGTGDLPRVLREPVIEGNKVVEKAISSPTLKEPNIGQRDYYNLLNIAKLWHVRLGHIGLRLLKKTSSITKGLPNFDKIKEADFHCSSYNRGKAVRRVSKALIPDPPRVLDSIEGDTVKIRPRPYNRNPIVLLLFNRKSRGLRNGFGRYPTKFHFDGGTEITDLLTTWLAERGIKFSTSAPCIHEQNGLVEPSVRVILDFNSTAITNKETTPFQAPFDELEPSIPYIPNLERCRAIGARGEAIIPLEKRLKSLKFTFGTEECKLLAVLGSKTYLVYIPSRRAVLKTSTVKFIEDNTVLSQPTDNTALEGELVDLDLDLEGAVSPDPSNLNTEKPVSIEIGPSKLEPYESSSDSKLDKPLPDKPINPVIVEPTRPTISIRKPELPEPITNKPLNNSDVILEGDKMQLDYYKLLAKTSSYILDKRSKWLEAITKEFIKLLELGVFKFLPRSLLPSNWAFLNSALREEIYMEIPKGLLDLAASNKAIYKLLLRYGYNPSTPNIIKLSKALYGLKQSPREWQEKLKVLLKSLGYLPLISDPGVFYNAKTCHFIVTYVDDCLFIGPDIGYITDLKKRLNKVYAIEDLGPAAYFLGLSRSLNRPTKLHLNAAKNLFKYLNSTKDYSICFSYNGNTVADLGPKLSNSSNTTTKLSRDFYSKEGPRPLTTTSTTIVDSRNDKGSSRTSIINSSLVPIGFSDSDFTGDKATSKSTYSYLFKLAGRPISWKTKRATTIALSTLEAETDGLTEAIREVQWIIGLFSELHRPIDYPITLYRDNQGSITVANNPALYARTKHTLLKFRYVREQVKAKIVTIIYLNTKFNSTGYFTAL
ncbi:hypothetical protein P8C59_004852 [Phyllachora maydis]|uniref:Integrase catalytic domain-containing protein n=1 Tax=Phyllachora maydis TaxID=1825666 RepID=A0AAD9MEV6_9PEZI|nr:hypothetical protein P8C59_004852 [Phyllachora maydis]